MFDQRPIRVLIAVHGYEPAQWAGEVCRVARTWDAPLIRLLGVLDVPSAPLTSLGRYAARAYHGARAAWTAQEEARLQAVIRPMLIGLPAGVDVETVPAARGDIAATVCERAAAWGADVVVVGAPADGFARWLRPGPVHQRILRSIRCAVLVTPPPPPPVRRVRHLIGGAFRRAGVRSAS